MPEIDNKNRVTGAVFFVLTLSISLFVFFIFLSKPGMNNNRKATLSAMVYGYAYRPMVYRSLLPTAVRWTTGIVPQSGRTIFKSFVYRHPAIRLLFNRFHLEADFPTETLIALILMYGCFLAFLLGMQRLYETFYSGSPLIRNSIPSLAALGLPPFFAYTNYPYDFCTLWLTALCLIYLAQCRWLLFLLCFTLACANKETAILMIPIFGIYTFKKGLLQRARWAQLLIVQVTIYMLIRAALWFKFQLNLGSMLEFHLYDHNVPMFQNWLTQGYSFGQLTVALVVVALICYGWSSKPLLLKLGLLALPPLLLACLFFGYFDEWRAYFDVYPAAMLLTVEPIGKLFGVKLREETLKV
ncbi:MAG: hypothetical protein PHX83_00445 [Acidobacteriia bacterium]|nr:hypothetical protein [Terriglobia bacterium]